LIKHLGSIERRLNQQRVPAEISPEGEQTFVRLRVTNQFSQKDSDFEYLNLDIVSNFVLRISDL